MKIVFIKPNIGCKDERPYFDSCAMQPLTIAVLAGLTPPGHDVVFYDDRVEDIPYDRPADLVGITAETYTAKRAYDIASQYRRRGVKVVLGGFHPTLAPEEAAEYADAVAIGEAEDLWPAIVEDAGKGRLKKFYKSEKRPSLTGLKPARDIFKGKKYLPVNLVEFGRGCRNSCEFCAVAAFFKSTHSHRPVGEVISEIKSIRSRNIFFIDDNIISDIESAKNLFRELIPLRIRWIGQAGIDLVEDEELLKLAAESGCTGLVIGLETLSRNNLSIMNKSWNLGSGGYAYALKKIKEYGIVVWAAFMFGYKNDDKALFDRTFEFSMEQKCAFLAVNHLMPYPGTKLYEDLSGQGRLIYKKWWIDERYRFGEICFNPASMSAGELCEQSYRLRRRFYSYRSILYRILDRKANGKDMFNITAFLKYNYLFRKELFKKKGMKFGAAREIS